MPASYLPIAAAVLVATALVGAHRCSDLHPTMSLVELSLGGLIAVISGSSSSSSLFVAVCSMSAALLGTGTTGGGVTSSGNIGLGPGEYASLQGVKTGGAGLPFELTGLYSGLRSGPC